MVNVQVEAAIQKLAFVLSGVFTVAQAQAVQIEVIKVGQKAGTDTVIFKGFLEDYLEFNAQLEMGTFVLDTNTMLGSVMLARNNSLFVGQGDNLTINLTSLIATMVVNVYGVETKSAGRSYSKLSPINISGISPRRVTVNFQDYLFIPNDGTVTVVELYYKGRSVRLTLAEMQAINRDLRGLISPNYNATVYAGFVNWLGVNLKDVIELELTPSSSNVNTTFYMVDEQVIFTMENGNVVKVNENVQLIKERKKDFTRISNPGGNTGTIR